MSKNNNKKRLNYNKNSKKKKKSIYNKIKNNNNNNNNNSYLNIMLDVMDVDACQLLESDLNVQFVLISITVKIVNIN